MFLGGFVESYGNPEEVKTVVNLLGFDSATAFRKYMNCLLGFVEVPTEVLKGGAEKLLVDPAKLKNYPFPLTVEAVVNMAN